MTAPITVSPSTANAVDYYCPAYREQEQRWAFSRLIRNLNESLRTVPSYILPQFEAEGDHSWKVRCAMTFAFDALDETIHALVGLATRDDPVLEEDVPPRLQEEWEDVDGEGTHGAVFAQTCLDFALQDGHAGILVDMPPAPKGLTLAQEAKLGLRAYMILVPIDRISAWRVGRLLGRKCLMMVKLEESREKPDGNYGSKIVKRFRTLRQEVQPDGTPFVTFSVSERQDNGAYVEVDSGTLSGPQLIPFHVFYAGEKVGILRSMPPLRGLAFSNLDHTQVKSDRRYSMHKCAIPVPIFKGRVRDPKGKPGAAVVISSDSGIDVSEGGGAEYLEPKGTALQTLRDELSDIERRMGSQGFSMLRQETPINQTLGEKEMQAAREESKLARAVRSLNDALEAALDSMAAFYGLGDGGSISMDREFSDNFLTTDELKLLNTMEDEGKLTLATFLGQVKKCTRLLEGVDLEQEIQAVEEMRASEPLTIAPAGSEVIPGVAPVPPAVPPEAMPPTQEAA